MFRGGDAASQSGRDRLPPKGFLPLAGCAGFFGGFGGEFLGEILRYVRDPLTQKEETK